MIITLRHKLGVISILINIILDVQKCPYQKVTNIAWPFLGQG